jgi:hypothetical protein
LKRIYCGTGRLVIPSGSRFAIRWPRFT